MTTATAAAMSPMLADVREGLARTPKELLPKYFYDRRGSILFERITQLPEYYLTRAERALLAGRMPGVIARLRPRSLVELGAGSADKTRIILAAMDATGIAGTYVPIDVSGDFLRETSARLRDEFPALGVLPVVADMTGDLRLPRVLAGPVLYAFLGSTIGNFDETQAVALLARIASAMTPPDRFLLGVDLRKDAGVLEAAYNDAAGVTAEFNLNVLRVLNRELGADFRLENFAHRACYDRARHRIEMHLVARRDHAAAVPGIGRVPFREGEFIRTEISCKYDRESVSSMFGSAGLRIDEWLDAPDGAYALVLGRRAP